MLRRNGMPVTMRAAKHNTYLPCKCCCQRLTTQLAGWEIKRHLAEKNVCVQAIPNHTDALTFVAVLIHDVVDHQWARLTNQSRLSTSAPFNCPSHRAITCPFLSVSQVSHGIEIGSDELAALSKEMISLSLEACKICFRKEQTAMHW